MATRTTVELTSDLVDLSEIPLEVLRDLRTPALDRAIWQLYERMANPTGDEIQEQRGGD